MATRAPLAQLAMLATPERLKRIMSAWPMEIQLAADVDVIQSNSHTVRERESKRGGGRESRRLSPVSLPQPDTLTLDFAPVVDVIGILVSTTM